MKWWMMLLNWLKAAITPNFARDPTFFFGFPESTGENQTFGKV